jgi:hypothetical protein
VDRLKRSTLEFIDPRAAIIQAKTSHPQLYPRGESHWSQRAAYIAYSQLMERLHPRFPSVPAVPLEDFDAIQGEGAADLVRLLGLQKDVHYTEELLNRRSPSHILRVDITPAHTTDWGWPVNHISNDLEGRPRLLSFGDSFTDYVLGPSFLYQTFSNPVHTHHNGGNFNLDLVRETKPDLVVFEFAERYLRLLPSPPSGD